MKRYFYKGPVLEFGRCIENVWTGTTMAPTDSKAKSNLAYQYKLSTNRLPQAKIDLPGTLAVSEGGK